MHIWYHHVVSGIKHIIFNKNTAGFCPISHSIHLAFLFLFLFFTANHNIQQRKYLTTGSNMRQASVSD